MSNSVATPIHEHQHTPNRFAVIPTLARLDADPALTGKGVTIAFLDSGFYPHSDLDAPKRVVAFKDLSGETESLGDGKSAESWQWHGTQTSVVAAGNGSLCDGVYRGIASDARLVLVKAGDRNGRITEERIAQGIEWVIANRERFNIRILNISLGGDEDVPCSLSIIDQAAEKAIELGITVVVAAGNSGAEGKHSIPPANSPSVITVGGYHDNNAFARGLDLYHSNFGATADGSIKPEIIAPAMWIAAPILPSTPLYRRAEALSTLAAAPDYELGRLLLRFKSETGLPAGLVAATPDAIRRMVEAALRDDKIVAAHYQHVDGTSFAAPIVASVVAQMIEANPALTPATIKSILLSTANRLAHAPAVRQGYGVINARRAVLLAKTEKHALASIGCGPPRVEFGRILFAYHDDEAQRVELAGEFNGWDPSSQPLQRDGDGLWKVRLAAPAPGRYEYKFLVNGERWIEDPANGMKVTDNHGGLNSVLTIA